LPRLDESRHALIAALDAHQGPSPGPGRRPFDDAANLFEAVASVALGLVARPPLDSRAFDALRDAGLLRPGALAGADPRELEDVLKQAGVRLVSKALRPLQKLARWAAGRDFEDRDAPGLATESLRDEWRAINGVGPVLADTLLLFAMGRPVYPVDRATYRILARHGWLDPSSDYEEARSVAESIAPDDPKTLARLSPALVRLGHDFCKLAVARCDRCPLRPFLPEGGPREVG